MKVNLFSTLLFSIFTFFTKNTIENRDKVRLFIKYLLSDFKGIVEQDSTLGLLANAVRLFQLTLSFLHDFACFYISFVITFSLASYVEML